ncbi:hypothetical protein [Salinibius halmophilus]|uniref:hypothetical protein n=1 Tax=Salinibius halmophilus TaxID=1853216 RepID=UPI000E6654BA|nr:hypothetical protein [Salinibius halmophilus]
MKNLSIFALLFLATFSIAEDPFNLSSLQEDADELGIVTQPAVDALEESARQLFANEQCKEAIPVLEDYSKKANYLANIITSTLEPYYGASYDDRKEFPLNKLRALIPYESLANDYKRKRNIAFAMRGECLMKLGDNEQAVPVLMKALDLMSIDEEEWWTRTNTNLLSIVDVNI